MDITRLSIFQRFSKACSLSSRRLLFFEKPTSPSSRPGSWTLLGSDLRSMPPHWPSTSGWAWVLIRQGRETKIPRACG